MGASQSITKVPPNSDVDYFFETANVWQGARGRRRQGHSSSSCPPTSSIDTASQPNQTLVGLQEQLTTNCQIARDLQTVWETQAMMESQTMKADHLTTVTPSVTQGKAPPIELPMYREMTTVFVPNESLQLSELRELFAHANAKKPLEEHYQYACSIERFTYENLCCRYCGIVFESSLRDVACHAVHKKHLANVYSRGMLASRKDYEFWSDLIYRALQSMTIVNIIELPLFREMTEECDHFDTLSYTELSELSKNVFPIKLQEQHFQAVCCFEKSEYAKKCCRYCGHDTHIGNSLKNLVMHAFEKGHLDKVYNTGRLVPRKDFEFWRDIIIRAEQLRLGGIGKAKVNDEQKLETTVVASCPVPKPESEPNTPTVPAPEPGPNTPTHRSVSDLTVSKQKTNTDFFYRDAKGDMQGAFQEEQMQEWYRKGYFDAKILIGIGQKEQLVPFSALLAENGSSTPFAYTKKKTSMSESYAVLTHRSWYLIPMLHPIAVPSQMLVTDEKLVDEVEKLREKFSARNKDSLDEVLSHLLTRSMNCELCSTVLFNSRSEFVAHILSRQHHEELWENRSGVTKHDIDYWNYVLDLTRPSEGPNEENARMLLNGRLRDEDGQLLYGQNVANEAETVPTERPIDFIQKPTSAVQPIQTWSCENAMNKKGVWKSTKTEKSARRSKRAEDAKIVAQQYPQVPTTVPFFKLTNTGPGLTRKEVTSACKPLRKAFARLPLKHRIEATMALLPRALTRDCVGCPICEIALHLGQHFMDHVLGTKHIAMLYSKNGAITQGDVDFYTKTIQECMK